MWSRMIPAVLVGALMLSGGVAIAEMAVLGVALVGEIRGQEPHEPFKPFTACEKDKRADAPLPVIDSTAERTVYFWNKVSSTRKAMLRHTWYLNGGEGWKQMAEVDLKILSSPGYRAWSSKLIAPSIHVGEWMIVVSAPNDSPKVQCIARFRVH
ncbi:MAG: DUF2914 domain-containing protein [Nitrospiraceae bacterium]